MKATVFIAISLDGYIARKDGGIDWLPTGEDNDNDEDYGYREFIKTVDAIVIGRNSYEMMCSFGSWPYGDMPIVVLSSHGVGLYDLIVAW